jgi:hypothetical protein
MTLSSDAKALLYMLKGMQADLPEEDKAKLNEATVELKAVIEKHGDMGKGAALVVCLELIAEMTT